MSRILSRIMGAFVGEGEDEISAAVARQRLGICVSNRCGIFNARNFKCPKKLGGCGCDMRVKVKFARVKKGKGATETVRCPKGFW